MLGKYRRIAGCNVRNMTGFRSGRKIVVIESDDWGSVRMPCRDVYEAALKAGYHVDRRPFERYDSLASAEDLAALFDVLRRFRDKNGCHPIVTANAAVANPDFEKIEKTGFREYACEPFTETLKRSFPGDDVFGLWRDGMADRIFRPQFHGREHFNIPRWLEQLQAGDEDAFFAFKHRMVGIASKTHPERGNALMVALAPRNGADEEFQRRSLAEGLDLFERIFGYRSRTFIAPCYTWSRETEPFLAGLGVQLLQGAFFQNVPRIGSEREKIRHYIGEKNAWGQYYTVRNCSFEPTLTGNRKDAAANCLREIGIAFRWKKPAIISSHRINYIGAIDPRNRNANLKFLHDLLAGIVRRYPDVEFMSSDEILSLFGSQ